MTPLPCRGRRYDEAGIACGRMRNPEKPHESVDRCNAGRTSGFASKSTDRPAVSLPAGSMSEADRRDETLACAGDGDRCASVLLRAPSHQADHHACSCEKMSAWATVARRPLLRFVPCDNAEDGRLRARNPWRSISGWSRSSRRSRLGGGELGGVLLPGVSRPVLREEVSTSDLIPASAPMYAGDSSHSSLAPRLWLLLNGPASARSQRFVSWEWSTFGVRVR